MKLYYLKQIQTLLHTNKDEVIFIDNVNIIFVLFFWKTKKKYFNFIKHWNFVNKNTYT